MKQSPDLIRIADVLKVYDEWFSRGHLYYWSQTPEQVRENLIQEANEDGILNYQRAVKILYAAQSEKLIGTANAGIQYMRQEWKKLKFREKPFEVLEDLIDVSTDGPDSRPKI